MNWISKRNSVFFIALSMIFVLWGLSSAWAAATEKIFLAKPFQITSEENLEFLKKGIATMLETRLTEPGVSRLVYDPSGGPVDYIVEGTILIFGNQVSTDVRLTSVSGKVELMFSETGEKKGDVLKHIDLFAKNIRTRILGLSPMEGLAEPVATASNTAAPAYAGPSSPQREPEIWRGPILEKEIQSIALADVDQDGKTETLLLTGNVVEVYRRVDGNLSPVFTAPLELSNVEAISLSAIDLDGDGKKEICVSGVNTLRGGAESYIYSVSADQLVKRIGPEKYFLRAVKKNGKSILLGQATRGSGAEMLKTPVVELKLAGNELVPGNGSYPYADNLFGIAFGDFRGTGEDCVAVLSLNGTISLYSEAGQQLYKGGDEYGGTYTAVKYKGDRYNRRDGYRLTPLFLQQQLYAADLHGDGKLRLVAVKNMDTAQGLLSGTRVYDKSYVDVLGWNELGFVSRDKTQTLNGYISDFTIGDMNSDGKEEIVFSLIPPNKLVNAPKSQLFSKR